MLNFYTTSLLHFHIPFIPMLITSASFLTSNTEYKKAPPAKFPEYAFIGRSNVGKSSLINMLTDSKGLAKTSQTPGKTQTINHFIINENWYLADLPGYGYAKVKKSLRETFGKMITDYLKNRRNLMLTFLLIDIRLGPQKIDLEFMGWMAENGLPFVILFTKADKLGKNKMEWQAEAYKASLLEYWEELPPAIITSAVDRLGKEEILKTVEETNLLFQDLFKE